ncbi:hypothetical protein D3C81_2022790 [compost metagenome]
MLLTILRIKKRSNKKADIKDTNTSTTAMLRMDIDSEAISLLGVIATKYQSLLCEGKYVINDFSPKYLSV